jgi:phosphate/sulfate permease
VNIQTKKEKIVGTTLTVLLLLFAVWLVSPFLHITRSSYAHATEYSYRLMLGLVIMLVFVGKWAFDAFAPQGLARKVSNKKAVALVVLSLIIMGFIVFVVAQATLLYLRNAVQQEQQQQQIIQLP